MPHSAVHRRRKRTAHGLPLFTPKDGWEQSSLGVEKRDRGVGGKGTYVLQEALAVYVGAACE